MKVLYLLIVILSILNLVNSHGYTVFPISRQRKCTSNGQNSIWWPEDGSGIKDDDCRAAYQHVYEKNNLQSEAVIQFTQENEYAVMIPDFDMGHDALVNAVKRDICSAGANDPHANFGDKSGMSVPFKWDATEIEYDEAAHTSTFEVDFCATATHNPSYWEFFLTNNNFDVENDPITWNDLQLVASAGNVPATPTTSSKCQSSNSYKMTITIPFREGDQSVLVVRWQRDDPAGECFINCSDIKFKKSTKRTKKDKKGK